MEDRKKTTKRQDCKISRRDFIGGAAAAAMAFTIVPRAVLGGAGHTPPSERLNIGSIGTGGRGTENTKIFLEHCDVQIVAVCDVDTNYRNKARDIVNEKYGNADCAAYKDFRELLAREDIDAVIIATPDHLHAVVSMAAIRMGKHVYCEKPLTHSVYEARKVTEAARQAKVATQMGNQGQASRKVRVLCEFIWDGAIGPVREVHNWSNRPGWPQGIGRPKEMPPVPGTLDWDLWLGPARFRPYNPAYLPFVWRGWQDFGTGALGDMACHSFAPIFRALKLGHPTSVEACSTKVNSETYPLASIIRYQFAARGEMPAVELTPVVADGF